MESEMTEEISGRQIVVLNTSKTARHQLREGLLRSVSTGSRVPRRPGIGRRRVHEWRRQARQAKTERKRKMRIWIGLPAAAPRTVQHPASSARITTYCDRKR